MRAWKAWTASVRDISPIELLSIDEYSATRDLSLMR